MKIIIDINKDVFEECQGHIYFPDTGAILFDAVKNGTPFDSVKAEIVKPIQEECCYIGAAKIQADTIKWCLDILDNIGNAESEE